MGLTTLGNSPATGSAVIAQTSRLLACPGEIRNRIYELAVEDTNAWPAEDLADVSDERERACKLRELRTLAIPHLRKQGTAEISWPALNRKYLGLTQTCRQLRAETSDMHSKIWTRVSVDELGDYTREVILKDVSDNKAAAGCIEIVGLQHQDDNRIDIRDFLLLYSEAPKLSLRLTPYEERSNPPQSAYLPLEPILQAKSSHSKLWDYIRDKAIAVLPMSCVTKNIIRCGFARQKYVRSNVTGLLVIGQGADPNDWTVSQTTENYYRAWEAWLEETGLPRNVMILPTTENIQHKLYYETSTIHLIKEAKEVEGADNTSVEVMDGADNTDVQGAEDMSAERMEGADDTSGEGTDDTELEGADDTSAEQMDGASDGSLTRV